MVHTYFAEFISLLKKSLSGRSADQEWIQHRQTKAKTLREKNLRVLDPGSKGALRGFSTRCHIPRTPVN